MWSVHTRLWSVSIAEECRRPVFIETLDYTLRRSHKSSSLPLRPGLSGFCLVLFTSCYFVLSAGPRLSAFASRGHLIFILLELYTSWWNCAGFLSWDICELMCINKCVIRVASLDLQASFYLKDFSFQLSIFQFQFCQFLDLLNAFTVRSRVMGSARFPSMHLADRIQLVYSLTSEMK